ncbi:MAG: calcium/sodium antiporter [Proteobacteria bacterium]|nr:calcium/sodium antiporter [Pseudomonadota bacterium]
MDAILLTLGLVILVGAGDALVRGAVALSLQFGIPAFIISVTVVAIGTSVPELLISVQAALADAPGIALGNVVGSNIANVLLVLGIPALIVPIAGCGPAAHRNLYLMLGATVLFSGFILGGTLFRWAGLVLVSVALFLVWDSVRMARAARAGRNREALDELAELEDADPDMATWKVLLLIAAGIVGLPIGAHFLIDGARAIARDFGISEAAIGLTVVAVGTSLPELATTVMAALRRHADVAIGNVIGSNIFNITAVIGAAALAAPLAVPDEIASRDLWVMIGATLLLTPFVLGCRRIGRPAGGVFLLLYGVYIYYALAG